MSLTKNEAIRRVLQIARAEIGYHEKGSSSGLDDPKANAGGGSYTKYARDLDAISHFYNGPKQGFAWCDVFVDWCFVKAFGAELAKQMLCQPDDSAGAGCFYSALYFRQAGRMMARNPEPGDQAFFTYEIGEISHTGIVDSVTESTVTTIEGNSSDGVVRRSYPRTYSSFYGFGRPRWDLAATADVSDPDTSETDPPDSPAAGKKVCTVILPELAVGDTGTPVERLQTLLIARGYYCGGRIFSGREQPDGDFGPATELAVEDFQLAAGIAQDKIVGTDTWTLLITT